VPFERPCVHAMSELRELLELGASEFEPAPAGWDRLLRRASRRRTYRRATAMVVASAVAIAGIGLVLVAFRSTDRPQPASVVENGKIAFSKGGPNGGIYLMNADGTGVERLTSDPGDTEPAWSPDGSSLGFVRSEGEKYDIYVMNADGGAVTRLTTDGASSAPAWSPDGTRIAFARDIPGDQDIYVMDPDGSDVARLTDGPLLEYAPAWSPEGTSIAFSAYASPPGPVHIYTMSADGTSRSQITSGNHDDGSPAWSPDGTSIAFVRDSHTIFALDPDGSGLREVIDPGGLTGGLGLTFYPTWSPEGTEIVFQSGPDGSDQRIYVVSVDGTGLHQVGSRGGSDPAWQPIPANGVSPTPAPVPQENFGLGYAVCGVTSIPITTDQGSATAFVFTKAGDNGECAAHGDGFAGVDVDDDGAIDATFGPLEDCFLRCEAFAAPDVNADGISEIAVSTEGADGYGVYLFVVSKTDHPSMDPITLEDPREIGYITLDPLQFAWVDVAGHFEGARCETLDNGIATLTIDSGDKLPPNAELRSTTLALDGSTATVVAASKTTMPLSDAPIPTNELCGTPLYNSAANFPNATAEEG